MAFDFVKICMSIWILLPNTWILQKVEDLEYYFQFSKLPSWALYFERKKREATKSLLPERCLMLTNNIPSLSLSGPKKIGDLNFNGFICSVFRGPQFSSSANTVEGLPGLDYTYRYDHHVVGEKWS